MAITPNRPANRDARRLPGPLDSIMNEKKSIERATGTLAP